MKKMSIANEAVLICVLSIVVYGVYGAMSPSVSDLTSDAPSWLLLMSPVLATVACLGLQKDSTITLPQRPSLSSKGGISLKILMAVSVAFFVPALISQSLTGDEIFYANYGFIHSIKLLPMMADFLPNIQNFEASAVVRVLSIFLVVGLGVLTYLLLKLGTINYYVLCAVALLILISARLVLVFLGGNLLVHAPLAGAFAMLSGAVLGVSDTALQAGHFLAYTCFGYFLYVKFRAELSRDWLAFLTVVSVLSIPGILFLGSVIEPALWTVMCYSIVMMSLVDNQFSKYKILVYVILIFSFLRISAIFSVIPLITHFLTNERLKDIDRGKIRFLFSSFSPLLIFAPFFLFAYFEGSSATSGGAFSPARFFEIFTDGTMWNLYADVISPFWLALYLFAIVMTIRCRFTHINIIFFLFLTLVFFSLNEGMWSFAKYRLEVFIPLLVSQLLFIAKIYTSKRLVLPFVAVSFFGLAVNAHSVMGFYDSCSQKAGLLQNINLRYERQFGCNYLTRVPFDLAGAMNYIKLREGMASTFVPGVFYGAFTHVSHGTTVNDYLVSERVWKDQERLHSEANGELFGANAEAIHADSRIDYVLLSFTKNILDTKTKLTSKGWTLVYREEGKYGLPVIILERPRDRAKEVGS